MVKKKTSKKKPVPQRRAGSNGLSRKQRIEIFAQGIVTKNYSQSDAYREAYPASLKWANNVVHVRASELAKHSMVKVRIAELKAKMTKRYDATIDRTIEELTKHAFFNTSDLFNPDHTLKELTPEQMKMFDALQVTIERNQDGKMALKELKTVDKAKYIHMLGQWLDMWTKTHVPTGQPPMPPEPAMSLNLNVDMNAANAGSALANAMAAHERMKKIRPQ